MDLTNLKFDDAIMDTCLADISGLSNLVKRVLGLSAVLPAQYFGLPCIYRSFTTNYHGKDYLKADNKFLPFGCNDNAKQGINVTLGHTVCNIFYSDFDEVCFLDSGGQNLNDKTCTGRRLARKIEENLNLFAQLEYLIRNIPIDDTKSHIQLIVQQLRCHEIIGYYDHDSTYLIMAQDTPLFYFGCVAVNCNNAGISIHLISTTKTAAVCRLFAQLCQEVGLEISLIFVQDPMVNSLRKRSSLTTIDSNMIKELNSGCTGVITERSDLDSAVDVFLSSTNTSPWKLRRILIQESVYESFKSIVTWKWNQRRNKTESDQQLLDNYRSFCTDVFAIDGKIFLLDYAGPVATANNLVMVEAYRTTKELLTLLKTHNSFYLSLWSSDASECNEIALAVTSSVVWVNDYATFQGAPATSQSIYTAIYRQLCSMKVFKDRSLVELCDLSSSWSKVKFEERIDILSGALKKFLDTADEDKDVESLKIAKVLLDDIFNLQSNTFIDVQDGKMCIGIKRAIGVILLRYLNKRYCSEIFKSVLHGNAFAIDTKDLKSLIEALKNDGIPVVFYNNWSGYDFEVTCNPLTLYKCKTIWSNFGTVFAN